MKVKLYTVPQAACTSQQVRWKDVAGMVNNQLQQRFDNTLDFQHIEFMDGRWFEDANAQAMLERGEVNFPFVLVDGAIVSTGNKVNVSRIIHYIQKNISK